MPKLNSELRTEWETDFYMKFGRKLKYVAFGCLEPVIIVISPQDSVASGRGCRGVCFLASNQEIVAVLYTV